MSKDKLKDKIINKGDVKTGQHPRNRQNKIIRMTVSCGSVLSFNFKLNLN